MRVGFAFAVIVTTFAAFTTPFTLEGADAMEVFNEAPTLTEENYAEEIPAEEEIVGEEEDDDFLSVDGVHLLDTKGQTIRFKESVYEDLNIMCYKGYKEDVLSFWSSSTLRLQIDSDDFELFVGRNVTAVHRMFEAHKATWLAARLPWKTKDVKLNPFERSCVGVLTKEKYSATLLMYRINYWLVLMTAVGVATFVYSPRLCRNVFFHYTTGIAAGVALSLLVATYFLQKRLRAGWFSWIMACYSLSLYFLTSMWFNVKQYLLENHIYVFGYFVVTGIVSFAICYRMGPVENPRTLNLIQWGLQLIALVIMYLSSYHQIMSFTLCLVLVSWRAVPDLHKAKFATWYHKRFFKPEVRLLTEAEFMDQSRIHTQRELEKLRQACQSPQFKSWQTVSKLQSPTRFAEFVMGSPHLTSEEVMNYSNADDSYPGDYGDHGATEAAMTDDESSSDGEMTERLRRLKE